MSCNSKVWMIKEVFTWQMSKFNLLQISFFHLHIKVLVLTEIPLPVKQSTLPLFSFNFNQNWSFFFLKYRKNTPSLSHQFPSKCLRSTLSLSAASKYKQFLLFFVLNSLECIVGRLCQKFNFSSRNPLIFQSFVAHMNITLFKGRETHSSV